MRIQSATSIADPSHFGTDPDSRISTFDFRIRILFFSSVAFKIPSKNSFFSKFLLLFNVLLFTFEGTGTFTSVFFKDKIHKEVTEQ
jgi:hypothetical protein